ncbi:myogenic factor 6-like [Panulirus ornatus]|uniref:myogenic factor 6-like n=1 Tax=Panulirus ornatus TaxID=150431 RepID=UPI003A8367A3
MIPGRKRLLLDCPIDGSSLHGKETVDKNNNASASLPGGEDDNSDDHGNNSCNIIAGRVKAGASAGKYQLRPRSLKARQCYDGDWNFQDTLRRKPRPPPLSRHRRKTANARERYRMRQINSAFESLRGVLPSWVCRRRAASELTKITTLRLASAYIRSLQDILDGKAHQDTCSWVLSSILGSVPKSQEPQPTQYKPISSPIDTQQPLAHTTPDSDLMTLLSGASEPGVFQNNLGSSYLSPLPDTDTFGLWLGHDPPRCWQPQHQTPLVT